MDYSLPATDGFAVARRMREFYLEVKVIMLTWSPGPCRSSPGRSRRASTGSCARPPRSTRLIGAVRQVHGGAPVFSAHDLTLVMQRVRTPSRSANDLTEREYEVLRLMAAGTSTEGMAEVLLVSVHTDPQPRAPHPREARRPLQARGRGDRAA